MQEENDHYIALVFDEMKIREDLVFNKHNLNWLDSLTSETSTKY